MIELSYNVSGITGPINQSSLGTFVISSLLMSVVVALGLQHPVFESQTDSKTQVARFEQTFPAMGVRFKLVAFAKNKQEFDSTAALVKHQIQMFEKTFSDYDSESEVMRLCASAPHKAPVEVSKSLFELVKLSKQFHQISRGAFDPSVGSVSRIWRMARKRNRLPDQSKIENAIQSIGFQFVKLLPDNRMQITRAGLQLDFGGIAKGYAADKAALIFEEHGLTASLIDAGGDIRVTNAPPGKSGWIIQLDSGQKETSNRRPKLSLSNCAVATSGDAHQRLEKNNVRHSHLVDPRTGMAVTNSKAVTVVAPTACTADALASALCVLDTKSGIELVRGIPNVQTAIFSVERNENNIVETIGFSELLANPAARFGD